MIKTSIILNFQNWRINGIVLFPDVLTKEGIMLNQKDKKAYIVSKQISQNLGFSKTG